MVVAQGMLGVPEGLSQMKCQARCAHLASPLAASLGGP